MSDSNTIPVSIYQKRFYVEWVLAPHEPTYNFSCIYKIRNLKPEVLKDSCKVLFQMNEALHLSFVNSEVSYYNSYMFDEFYDEITVHSELELNDCITKITEHIFDLNRGKLVRFCLIKYHQEYYFIICAHHIVTDGCTGGILCQQISKLYQQLFEGSPVRVEDVTSYKKAIDAERKMLSMTSFYDARKYWLKLLKDTPLYVDLPYVSGATTLQASNHVSSRLGSFIYFKVHKQQMQLIKEYAKQNDSSLFVILATMFAISVARASNLDQLVLSCPINVRPEIYADVVGCFVNNLPLKVELDKHIQFLDLLRKLTNQWRDSRQFQHYPFHNIMEDLRSANPGGLKHLNLGFGSSYLNSVKLDLPDAETQGISHLWSKNTIYDLSLLYDGFTSEDVRFKLEYRMDAFHDEYIQAILKSFHYLLEKVILGENVKYMNFEIIDNIDFAKPRSHFCDQNNNQIVSSTQTIIDLFEFQVEKAPDNIALSCEGVGLSYEELNKRVNQLANYLCSIYRINIGDKVILHLDRNEYTIIAIFALLKLGATYVPIVPDSKEERIAYIVKDTNAKLILTNNGYLDKFNTVDIAVKAIDTDLFQAGTHKFDIQNIKRTIDGESLAYIIYTSGSTGNPKGVMVDHAGLYSFCYQNNFLSVSSENNVLSCSNYAFDGSCFDIFYSLCNGAHLVIPSVSASILDYDCFTSIIDYYSINTMFITTALFEQYIAIGQYDSLSKLKAILFGGEKANASVIKSYFDVKPVEQQLIHVYGPTETIIFATSALVTHENINLLPIGKPLADKVCYVLDKNRQVLPVGTIGELYIGGNGVAKGYLNNPELTEECFMANPFQTPEEKALGLNRQIYKTGDLVRCSTDGDIEYIGRNDRQVKIHGYRIELNEVEKVLTRYPGVKQSVAVMHQSGSSSSTKSIIAYYQADHRLDENELLNFISKYLPTFMLPGVLLYLNSIPLTVNGKIDYKALSEVDFKINDNYVAPRTELEKEICKIFSEVLNLDISKVGVFDNFFKLGGNSILIVNLFMRLKQVIKIQLENIFKNPTPSLLMELADRGDMRK